ncbi:MAG: hypothetical protein GY822_03650 [Deltaproteobacteria bacterium]|nr:hypothetical protein [Deltaproteobacteria bacterium]
MDKCGNQSAVGDCWNKEHSWPKSWWGGQENDAYSDMFHLVPSDGRVNNYRSNLPFGEVDNPTFGGGNEDGIFVEAKMGPCVTPGSSGNCFEPADDVKGDLARGYFYMAVRYEGLLTGERDAVSGADIKIWQESLLRDWHLLDPVDDAERTRNDAILGLQGNRNPFIDHPEWVGQISDFFLESLLCFFTSAGARAKPSNRLLKNRGCQRRPRG